MSNIPPVLPLTYADLVAIDDLDPLASETTSDLQTLAQDIYHILEEDPGSNLDDPERGVGVIRLLSGDTSVLQTLPHTIESELLKDDRIDQVNCTIVAVAAGGTFSNGDAAPEQGGYELQLQYVPSGSVLPQSLSFAAGQGGLVPLS